MLAIQVKEGGYITIGPEITVHVVAIRGTAVRLGVTAPERLAVHRDTTKVRRPKK